MSRLSFNQKFCGLDAAVRRRKRLRAEGKAVVLTNGVFDLLHRGHLYCLFSAVQIARNTTGKDTALFVALNGDASVRALKGPTRPVQTEEDRAYALAALGFVHTVFVFNTPRLDREILRLQPDVYVKAGDYAGKLDPGEHAALQKVGAKIKFAPLLAGYSTTLLIQKIAAAAKAGAI